MLAFLLLFADSSLLPAMLSVVISPLGVFVVKTDCSVFGRVFGFLGLVIG